jgi:hypothetical protein
VPLPQIWDFGPGSVVSLTVHSQAATSGYERLSAPMSGSNIPGRLTWHCKLCTVLDARSEESCPAPETWHPARTELTAAARDDYASD